MATPLMERLDMRKFSDATFAMKDWFTLQQAMQALPGVTPLEGCAAEWLNKMVELGYIRPRCGRNSQPEYFVLRY